MEKKSRNSLIVIILLTIDTLALSNFTGPMAKEIAVALSIAESQVGDIEALFLLVGAFSSLVWAMIGDKFSRKKLLFIATLTWSVFSLLSGLAEDYISLLLFQMGVAVGFGGVIPLTYSLTLDLVDAEKRGRALGFLIAANAIGSGFGLILAGELIESFSFSIPFIVISILGFAAATQVLFMYEPTRGERDVFYEKVDDESLGMSFKINVEDLKDILKKKSNVWLLLMYFMLFVGVGPTTYFFVSMLRTDHGFAPGAASIFMVVIYLSQLFGAPFHGNRGDRKYQTDNKGRLKVIISCFLIGPIFYIVGYALNFTSDDTLMIVLFLLILSVGSFFISGIDPLAAATLGDLNPPKVRATIYSLSMVAQTVGRAVGIIICGALLIVFGGTYQPGFIIMGIIFLISVIFIIPLLKTLSSEIKSIKSDSKDKEPKPAVEKEEKETYKPMKIDKLFDKGIELIEKENFDGAIECFVKVIKKNPKNSKAWSNKGLAHNGNWEYEEAIKCFNIVLELDPSDIIACFNKAVALNDFGKHEEAIECYNEVLRIDPDFDAEELNQILLDKFEKDAERSD